jgi:transcription-repair coupling factor (superfamily II helicase)
MSRFQSAGEVTETQRGLADGTVDVVIGTHRLLSPETRFKQLGLVIIDEEQRFGVEHKEYLKRLRTEVDVLAMSATPIPRTLEMGVAGIREMSTILTPPEERHPVLTARTTRSRSPPRSGASCSATGRSSSCTTGCSRSRGWPPGSASSCLRRGSGSRTGR